MTYHENKETIDACLASAALCHHCAASCLQETDVKMMANCIQLDMECAALCTATAQLLSLGSPHASALAKICAAACEACAAECSKHTNVHCQECATACKICADYCKNVK
jgi:hypothetical protein